MRTIMWDKSVMLTTGKLRISQWPEALKGGVGIVVVYGKSSGSLTNYEVVARLLAKPQALLCYSESSSCPQNLPPFRYTSFISLPSFSHPIFWKMAQEPRLWQDSKCQRISSGFWICTEGKTKTLSTAEQRSSEAVVEKCCFSGWGQRNRGRLLKQVPRKAVSA